LVIGKLEIEVCLGFSASDLGFRGGGL